MCFDVKSCIQIITYGIIPFSWFKRVLQNVLQKSVYYTPATHQNLISGLFGGEIGLVKE
jgi:hypothetical protein